MPKFRPTQVEIHLAHLQKNYEFFSSSVLGKIFMCPMVKANAYGHGDLKISQFLENIGCKNFGVGLVEEGLRLREKGNIRANVLVFGFTGREACREMIAHHLTPVVSDFGQLQDLREQAQAPLSIHLKFNTGMNRLGFALSELPLLLERLAQVPQLQVQGLCTHLATAEELPAEGSTARRQLDHFAQVLAQLLMQLAPSPTGVVLHAFNSAGAIHTLASADLRARYPYGLRTGISLYGLSPMKEGASSLPLQPVMSLKSTVVAVQEVKRGESVSYGGTWTASRDSVIGIVPVGYADGIPTQLSNRGHVVTATKQKLPIAGRVCMDYTLVDMTSVTNPLGQIVEFFGFETSAHQLAQDASTIPWDVLTRISERVPRVFVGDLN